MPCKFDVKQAIFDKAINELAVGRYSFSRLSDNTIQVNSKRDNSKSRAENNSIAMAMAKTMATRISDSFETHVRGNITQYSIYDPITITLEVNPAYVEHEYNKLPSSQQTDTGSSLNLSPVVETTREDILNNTGPNSRDRIKGFNMSPTVGPTGIYTQFVTHKKMLLRSYRNKLNAVKSDLTKDENQTVEKLAQLKKQKRDYETLIRGDDISEIGIEKEIENLEKGILVSAISYYVQKDLDRLRLLSLSNDINEIQEAKEIIDFYQRAADFRYGKGREEESVNPFFSKDDIFLSDEHDALTTHYKLDEATMNQYKAWAAKAANYANQIDIRGKEVLENLVNSDASVRATYGDKQFTTGELLYAKEGLRDTHWIDMWTMDVTSGTFSNNGLIPQVMFNTLVDKMQKKLVWSRNIAQRVDKIVDEVQDVLSKMDGGKYSLAGKGIGLSGASYDLFAETTKEGNKTNSLIQRFTRTFIKDYASKIDRLKGELKTAYNITDDTVREEQIRAAYQKLRDWRRRETIVLDINKIPEIVSEFSSLGGVADNNYRDYLIGILGQKGYDEEIKKQRIALNNYLGEKESYKNSILIREGKEEDDELSLDGDNALRLWEMRNSPVKGIQDYYNVHMNTFGTLKVASTMDYNILIPRKNKVDISISEDGKKYEFTDNNEKTEHYNENFNKIESTPVLSEFYDIMKEVAQKIKQEVPYDIAEKMEDLTFPSLMKTSLELVANKETSILARLSTSFRHMLDNFRTGFGAIKQGKMSSAEIDTATGKRRYNVNGEFLKNNFNAIHSTQLVEHQKFLQAYNYNTKSKIDRILQGTTRPLESFDTESLILLAKYTHTDISLADIKNRNIQVLRDKVGDNVEIGRLIRDYSVHMTVQKESFDLAKLAKHFSNAVMLYTAREEALPILTIVKDYYNEIKNPETTNFYEKIVNSVSNKPHIAGQRNNAEKQMEDWFKRALLNDFEQKHWMKLGSTSPITGQKRKDLEGKIATLNAQIANTNNLEERRVLEAKRDRLSSKKGIHAFDETIYTKEERQRYGEIQSIIDKGGLDEKTLKDLQDVQQGLGKTRSASAVIDNVLDWVRGLKLKYNLSSMSTNFFEGVASNMILGASTQYFKPDDLYYGYSVNKWSFVKNLSFGKWNTPMANKCRYLMDRLDVVMDSRNELQKSSNKTFTSKLSWAEGFAGNQRVEYLNQSPLMIAMLRGKKIYSSEETGKKESNVWDAYEYNEQEGKFMLKADFRTQDNIDNWENLNGEEYTVLRANLKRLIEIGHGNYDELKGMLIKSNTMGKAGMMFKTWMPNAFFNRFALEHDDINSGTIGYKGRYWSYGIAGGGLHGALTGGLAFGPVGFVLGGAAGAIIGARGARQSSVGLGKELVIVSKQLVLKALSMPVNLTQGKELIKSGQDFDAWVTTDGKFTQHDANNMKANMADLAMNLLWISILLMVKMLWYDDDDDDDKDSKERGLHNVLANKAMQLSSQAQMFLSPADIYKNTLGSMAVIKFLTDVGKFFTSVGDLVGDVDGDIITGSSPNAGQHATLVNLKKIVLPGVFKDPLTGGFENEAEKQFYPSRFDDWFKSDSVLDDASNKKHRAKYKLELESRDEFKAITNETLRKKKIQKALDRKFPTTGSLEKRHLSRDEYEDRQDNEDENE